MLAIERGIDHLHFVKDSGLLLLFLPLLLLFLPLLPCFLLLLLLLLLLVSYI